MADRVEHWLGPVGGLIVDATFGGGGHTRVLLDANRSNRILALDRDPDAGEQAAALGNRVQFRLTDFRKLEAALVEEECDAIDGALFDLGVSSHQLDVGERGFSFRLGGPLDMRMGPDAPLDARTIVNEWEGSDLARILRIFGEERHARRIADAIVSARPIADTIHLASVVADAMPARSRRTGGHPARRTFQALRIAVNDELAALTDALDVALRVLRPGGRIVVISYHSLEDRIVKRRFAEGAVGCTCPPDLPVCVCGNVPELRILSRGETPSEAEVEDNPRARSARLRAVEKAG